MLNVGGGGPARGPLAAGRRLHLTVMNQGANRRRRRPGAKGAQWGNVSAPAARRASFLTRAPPVAFLGVH